MPELATVKLTPVLKKKADPTLPLSYRSIAVQPVLSKLLQALLYRRLYQQLIQAGKEVVDQQAGFLKGRSTMEQILLADMLVTQALSVDADGGSGSGKVYSMFLDLCRAFPSVNIDILMSKLADMGVTGRMWAFLYRWLKSQQAYVHVGKEASSTFRLHKGLPEGALLSPLLFLLYFNELLKELQAEGSLGSDAGIRFRVPTTGGVIDVVVAALAFADDVRLFATTAEGLQRLANVCGRVALKLRAKLDQPRTGKNSWGRKSPGQLLSCPNLAGS